MRAIWAMCAAAACITAMAAAQAADFPMVVVIMSVLTMVVSWL
jgi:uncharacterized protein (DUF983 family)